MRFIGYIDAKTDAKGRIFLPAAFRKVLQAHEEERLVLRRDVFQKCLVLYPASVWDKQVDAITERTNMFDPVGRQNLRRFVADAESIVLDGSGRLLIPRRYLEFSGIESDVRFIGMDNTIEIWNRQAADALLEDTDSLAASLEMMFKNPTHASPKGEEPLQQA